MRTNKLTVTRKLLIAEETIQVNNVKATARKDEVHISQILKLKQIVPILKVHSEISPKKLPLHQKETGKSKIRTDFISFG